MDVRIVFLICLTIFIISMMFLIGTYFVIFFSHQKEKRLPGHYSFILLAIVGTVFPFILIEFPVIEYMFRTVQGIEIERSSAYDEDYFNAKMTIPLFLYFGIALFYMNLFAMSFYEKTQRRL